MNETSDVLKEIRVTTQKPYAIRIESGLFNRLPLILSQAFAGKKLAVVCDSNVYTYYGKSLVEGLHDLQAKVCSFVFEAGEQHKNMSTLAAIYEKLANEGFTRSDALIALGGGVTGDMGGLAAATFLRGLQFIQIPTTLLAMVDSSIGGKVAIDLPQGKNLIGTFYQPDAVYTDPGLLKTLDDRQYASGMAELIKHGLIMNSHLCDRLLRIGGRQGMEPYLDDMVYESCVIKKDIVVQDERDEGLRQLLNFGHTIGHALEKVQHFVGFTHGEAVAAGMVAMTRMTTRMGITRSGVLESLMDLLKRYQLPVDLPDDIAVPQLLEAIRLDKKTRSGKITIVYLEAIGCGKLLDLSLDELEERLIGTLENKG